MSVRGKRHRGFGFATFTTEASAKAALDALNAKELPGAPSPCLTHQRKTFHRPVSQCLCLFRRSMWEYVHFV